MAEEKRKCSFCGLDESNDIFLIQGDNCYICNNCIEFCYNMICSNVQRNEEPKEKEEKINFDLTPHEIYERLCECCWTRLCEKSLKCCRL